MMSQIQPACNSKKVKNKYFLTIRCTYEGCICCADTPMAKIPLVIMPVVNPECYGWQVPEGFEPQQQE